MSGEATSNAPPEERNTGLSASDQRPFETEIARMIVDRLNLEIGSGDIDPEQPLFGDGLGLDSIDALELSLALSRDYGLELRSDDPGNPQIFASLRSFAAHIEALRTKSPAAISCAGPPDPIPPAPIPPAGARDREGR